MASREIEPLMGPPNTQSRMGEDEKHRPEDTPAYRVLKANNMLESKYRVDNVDSLEIVKANSDAWTNCCLDCWCCCFKCMFRTFQVRAGTVTLVEDGRGNFELRDKGVHLICDPFYSVGGNEKIANNQITWGDIKLVVVQQGHIGFAMDKGQPVLLPPGLHQWRSPTMEFQKSFDLNNNVVPMGPLTLITVDDGYCALTENNGAQVILEGGDTYLLNHRNWKFKKFVSKKINSNNMKRIKATSADNVLMAVDATVIWRIDDVNTAAKNAAETIHSSGGDLRTTGGEVDDISKLREDVLKQAEASLAAFIGGVNYSDKMNVARSVQDPQPELLAESVYESSVEERDVVAGRVAVKKKTVSLFDPTKLLDCVSHANKVTTTYGVKIISINVVAAVPADEILQTNLAQGAVAAAAALKDETVARGRAAACLIEAKGLADAAVIKAKGEAEAETTRADGSRKAADLLSGSEVAVRFQMVEKTGHALHDKTSFFFGADQQNLDGLLAPAVVAAAAGGTSSMGAGYPAQPAHGGSSHMV